jgi:hypothetical protein
MRGEYAPERKPVAVEISLTDGSVVKGKLWAAANKSLADTLNGSSAFLEFTPYGDERAQFLSRSHVLSLSAIDIPKSAPLYERRGSGDADDPHHILGVAPGSTWQDVREAYVRLAKAYHPDRFAGVTLPEEVTQYLGNRARTINAAYAVLEGAIKARLAANGSGANGGAF